MNNSTDNTFEVCSKIPGIHVYKYDNDKERTKGFALDHLVKQIIKDYGVENYDGFFSFDADNLVDNDYFNRMNDAFFYYKKKYTIIGNRIGKNFSQNFLSTSYSLFFMADGYFIYRGRTACGVSIKNGGTGYLMPSSRLKNGYNYHSVTEDWEMSVDELFRYERGAYCEEAIFYDEQPTTFKVMWKQRLRWIFGHLEIYSKNFVPLIKRIFKKDTKNRFDTYDVLITITPLILFYFILIAVQALIYAFIPLIDKSLTYQYVFLNYNNKLNFFQNLIYSDGYLFIVLKSLIIFYIFFFILGIVLLILSRKIKIKRKPIIVILGLLFFPIFVMLELPITIHAIIKRRLRWDPTPHKENINIKSIDK